MTDEVVFTVGTPVSCEDGPVGEISRIVIDPVSQQVTHVVVDSKDGPAGGTLAPIEGAVMEAGILKLPFARRHFATLESAVSAKILPSAVDQLGHQRNQLAFFPYFGLGFGSLGPMGIGGGTGMFDSDADLTEKQAVTFDRVPTGEVEVRPGDPVHATDGPIGHVEGLVIDPADHHVTHILLAEGHLWGKKDVSIPISAISGLDASGANLSLSKSDVESLPSIEFDRPHVG